MNEDEMSVISFEGKKSGIFELAAYVIKQLRDKGFLGEASDNDLLVVYDAFLKEHANKHHYEQNKRTELELLEALASDGVNLAAIDKLFIDEMFYKVEPIAEILTKEKKISKLSAEKTDAVDVVFPVSLERVKLNDRVGTLMKELKEKTFQSINDKVKEIEEKQEKENLSAKSNTLVSALMAPNLLNRLELVENKNHDKHSKKLSLEEKLSFHKRIVSTFEILKSFFGGAHNINWKHITYFLANSTGEALLMTNIYIMQAVNPKNDTEDETIPCPKTLGELQDYLTRTYQAEQKNNKTKLNKEDEIFRDTIERISMFLLLAESEDGEVK